MKTWPSPKRLLAALATFVATFANPAIAQLEIGRIQGVDVFACIDAAEAVKIAKVDQDTNGDLTKIHAAMEASQQCGQVQVVVMVKRIHSVYMLADGSTTWVIEFEGDMGDGTHRSIFGLTDVAPKGSFST